MIYKTLKKVSDYCQLLDKSKYPATQTVNGVTFTNNGDGTITANGTATEKAVLVLFFKTLPIIRGKGLIIGDPQPGYAFINYMFYNNKNEWLVDNASYHGNGVIFTGKDDAAYAILYIAIEPGSTANNLIFKPQLFDLTEIYGAGNEPTTVEQFRQDFPEELYDYKPYCFVKSYKTLLKATDNKIITSYKKSLVCKTKNLFNNILAAANCRVSFATSRAIATQIAADTDTTGLFKIVSYNGSSYEVLSWIHDVFTRGRVISTFTTPETTGYKTIIFGLNGTKIDTTCQCEINLKPSTTYTFCCSFTNITQGSISWTDMQLEEGNTTTEYHPYGYL